MKSIFERLSLAHEFSPGTKRAMTYGEIGLFGVRPSGAITEDYDSRGEIFQRDVSKTLKPFFSGIHAQKNGYVHIDSLNELIDIYAPVALSRKEILLEWAVFSGVVDTHTQLESLSRGTKPIMWNRNFFELRNAINGENCYNCLNMAIDFKHGIVITRNMARLSGSGNTSLAERPIIQIKKPFDLFITNKKILYDKERAMQQHFNREKAKALAFDYIRRTFFQ